MTNYEIERKFLIAFPDMEILSRMASRRLEMVQTYLQGAEGESRRVRKVTENRQTTYWKTEKKRISDIRRVENETEITEEVYHALLSEADKERRPIEKVRYCVPNGHQTLEIDIFPFWQDKAFLEVELSNENEAISLPSHFHVIREVTEDKRYTNAALAKKIPE